MKKILAFVAAISVLMACGGNSGKKQTVEQKAVSYVQQLLKFEENEDYEQLEKLEAEMQKWYESLSDEDKAKADEAAMKYIEELENEYEAEKCCEATKECACDEECTYEEVVAEEEEEVAATANEWDELLDQYEEYVDEYVKLYKKVANGDMTALTKATELAEEMAELSEKVSEASAELTTAQAKRLADIAQKYADAANSLY